MRPDPNNPVTITKPLLIEWHLKMEPTKLATGDCLWSTLTKPLREVRKLAMRNELTGEHQDNGKSPSWMAAMGYLSLIEQLGNAYDLDLANRNANRLKRSLEVFSDLDASQREIINGLRCSLFHDFAIVRNDGSPKYIFNVGPEGTAENFIRPAMVEWQGEVLEGLNLRPCVTVVGLAGIGDLFESVIFPRVKELAAKARLEMRLKSLVEFQYKYFWMIGPLPQ